MGTEELNAPEGEQNTDALPGETIANDMATRNGDEPINDEPENDEGAPTEPVVEGDGEEPARGGDEGEDSSDEQEEKPKKPAMDWRERRRIEETNKRREAEAENARLKAELERYRKAETPPAATPDALEAPITADEAVQRARQQLQAEQQARTFQEATGRVLKAGLETHPDFEEARTELVNNFRDQLNQRQDFFEAIIDVPNGHDVFYHLGKNPEEADRILSLPPIKLAMEIERMSTRLGAPAAPAAPKPISKAPAPVKPVNGAPQSSGRLDDADMPMDAWANSFLKQMKGKGR